MPFFISKSVLKEIALINARISEIKVKFDNIWLKNEFSETELDVKEVRSLLLDKNLKVKTNTSITFIEAYNNNTLTKILTLFEENKKQLEVRCQNVIRSYLSNDTFYGVAYLRKSKNNAIPTGHIHVGFSKDVDPPGNLAENRTKMLEDMADAVTVGKKLAANTVYK